MKPSTDNPHIKTDTSELFPLVTVIIPIFNVSKYLEECVISVMKQTYTNLEIILSDDGSTDGSAEIADNLSLSDSRVKVIHSINSGSSAARNRGLDVAKGDYILFIDGDDMVHKVTIERLMKIANLYSASLVMTPEPELSAKPIWQNNMPQDTTSTVDCEDFIRLFLTRKAARSACCDLFRRDVIGNLRFKEGVIGEDALFMAEIIPKINFAVFTCNNYYFYRINHTSQSHLFTQNKFDLFTNALDIDSKMSRLPYDIEKERQFFIVTNCVDYCMQVIKHKAMREFRKEYVEAKRNLTRHFLKNLLNTGLSLRYKLKFILACIK